MRICFFVDTLADQGIVDVRHGYDLGGDRDLVSLQAIRITLSIPALMVPSADLVSKLYKALTVVQIDLSDHGRTNGRVGLHDLKFLFC